MSEHYASPIKGLVWLLIACGIGAFFGLGLGPLSRAIPWSWEKRLGDALEFSDTRTSCHPTAAAQAELSKLVTRIYPVEQGDGAFSIHVRVVDDQQVNAYAAPGGYIVLNAGLFAQATSPEEITAVLAHEIGHVEHRDIMKGAIMHMLTSAGVSAMFGNGAALSQWAHYFLRMDFTRMQEEQADEAGLMRLQAAHVDNRGFQDFFARMAASHAAPAFLSDHPADSSRLEMAKGFANTGTSPVMTPQEWLALKHYCY